MHQGVNSVSTIMTKRTFIILCYIFLRELGDKIRIRPVLLDCGAVQSDALTVNRELSLQKYKETAMDTRADIIAQESAWMKEANIQVVVSDIVPIACAVGKEAGLPVVCCSNFSWDFFYSEYLVQYGQLYPSIVQQIADDYAQADLLLRLPGYVSSSDHLSASASLPLPASVGLYDCASVGFYLSALLALHTARRFCYRSNGWGQVPMPAFRRVQDVPLVVRMAVKSREQVLQELGIPLESKVICLWLWS